MNKRLLINLRALCYALQLVTLLVSFSEVGVETRDDQDIDCDEMARYYKELAAYFQKQCDSKCPEKVKHAVDWFERAHAKLANDCYYDIYDGENW
ncbi:uncharacterized protein LOC129770590 isoform X2 [Toxorhynchites rutilus septentrionalis]|uniref:uncharacterized protein LOC129770590 isoform X2 n=1 Tax=Toxorhynchites rutilus septentrionalis TaxID=329112 RepID=UPI002478C400|nr:uncharacterized protein LOC129770590 isoform X2 [Toxorhynchites rutilus septentrionalis]